MLADPPYNVKLGVNQYHHRRLDTHPDIYLDNKPEKEYQNFIKEMMKEFFRISQCIIITPGNGNQWLYPKPKWTMIWRKMNGMTITPLTRWRKICICRHEPVLVYGQLDNPPVSDIIDCPISMQPNADGHPCPKPLKLFSHIIRFKDGLILDPFLGSGTTAVAAKQLGRRFIGIEISPKHVALAEKRLQFTENPLFI